MLPDPLDRLRDLVVLSPADDQGSILLRSAQRLRARGAAAMALSEDLGPLCLGSLCGQRRAVLEAEAGGWILRIEETGRAEVTRRGASRRSLVEDLLKQGFLYRLPFPEPDAEPAFS
ncbi:hypothetical protein LAZ40_04200 [Cereibacter sphaeroides]|uniref:hypothetical protein n=1 Tax=Cereibacter sphaeroides TaxID=1063 RepID=UPI001F45B0B7|nr:hypothetical protein [Cereibacter sphaeroides]MCE6958256.1 hypothetical protein [Cereibacter sphaeroides]MCE6971195.1 hypothetical protein [Cereibacter sphaeroides]